jgi:hypothetical protein
VRSLTWADHQIVPSGAGMWINTPRRAKIQLKPSVGVPAGTPAASETPETV